MKSDVSMLISPLWPVNGYQRLLSLECTEHDVDGHKEYVSIVTVCSIYSLLPGKSCAVGVTDLGHNNFAYYSCRFGGP